MLRHFEYSQGVQLRSNSYHYYYCCNRFFSSFVCFYLGKHFFESIGFAYTYLVVHCVYIVIQPLFRLIVLFPDGISMTYTYNLQNIAPSMDSSSFAQFMFCCCCSLWKFLFRFAHGFTVAEVVCRHHKS